MQLEYTSTRAVFTRLGDRGGRKGAEEKAKGSDKVGCKTLEQSSSKEHMTVEPRTAKVSWVTHEALLAQTRASTSSKPQQGLPLLRPTP